MDINAKQGNFQFKSSRKCFKTKKSRFLEMSIEHLMNIKSTQNATFTIRICNSFIIFLKKNHGTFAYDLSGFIQ